MNTFKLLVRNRDDFIYLEVTFDNEKNLKKELTYNKDSIEDIPHIITDLYHLSCWSLSDKTYEDFVGLFLHKPTDIDIVLKPAQLKRTDKAIEGNGYYIHINSAGILVNYKKGKFKEFTLLYLALDWICNVHYPAQQVKQLREIIL